MTNRRDFLGAVVAAAVAAKATTTTTTTRSGTASEHLPPPVGPHFICVCGGQTKQIQSNYEDGLGLRCIKCKRTYDVCSSRRR